MARGKYNVILSSNEVCCQLYGKAHFLLLLCPRHPSLFPLHFLLSLHFPPPSTSSLSPLSQDWLIEVIQQHLMAFEIFLYSCRGTCHLTLCVCACVRVCVHVC